ncbi:unnamed protein product [Discosporangium mesarthrocarpum]
MGEVREDICSLRQKAKSTAGQPEAQEGEERVVFYCGSFFKIDGVTLTIRGLIRHVLKKGGKVMVVTADSPSRETVEAFVKQHQGCQVSLTTGGLVPLPGSDYYLGLYLSRKTKRVLEAFNPTSVHITNPDLVATSLIKWVLLERPKTSLTATLHTNFQELVLFYNTAWKPQMLWLASSFLSYTYGLCPAVYVPTEFMRKKLLAENWDTKLGVWGRGVDADLFSPAKRSEELRKEMGLGPRDVGVLWLGRMVAEKQPDKWLGAVKKVQKEAVDEGWGFKVVGVCVGDGEAKSLLEGVEGVICLGWRSGEALAMAISSCDVFVFPSEIETFGRVTLEAMSSGLPCVVNKECGDHLVKDGKNGVTLPVGETDGYTNHLRELVKDPALREKMGSSGRSMALSYSTTEVYDRMLEVYKSARTYEALECRKRYAQKQVSFFWEVGGLVVYFLLEILKLFTAVVALLTRGSDSEEVRLCVKSLGMHRQHLGHILAANAVPLAILAALITVVIAAVASVKDVPA